MGTRWLSIWLQCAVIVLATCVKHTVNTEASKSASITLTAKWPATPLVSEAMMFLAEEDVSLAWKFVDVWGAQEKQGSCWNSIVSAASRFLSPSMIKVLEFSLGIREYSPKLEVIRVEAEKLKPSKESCAFVDIGSRLCTTPDEIEAALKSCTPQSCPGSSALEFDIVYHSGTFGRSRNLQRAVLYGTPGEDSFTELHNVLKSKADEGLLSYVMRPLLTEKCSERAAAGSCLAYGTGGRLQVPGFGVEMAIKDMEYSALDDKKVAEEQAQARGGTSLEDDLQGYNFTRLVEQRPESEQQLLEFRDYLLASSSQEESLKVWDLKNLGLQAAQKIVRSSDPLRTLTDLSQKFPNLVSSLSKSGADEAVWEELKTNQATLPPGQNFLLLNGLQFEATSDLYQLLHKLRSEVQLSQKLKESGLQTEVIQKLLGLRADQAKSGNAEIRIDFDSSCRVGYLNDFETEYRRFYRGWERSFYALLNVFPGSVPRLARNLFNFIYVVDPGTLEGLSMARHAHEVASARKWPVRLGLVLSPASMTVLLSKEGLQQATKRSTAELSLGEKITMLYYNLAEQISVHAGGSFLANLAERVEGSGSLDALTNAELESVYGAFDSEPVKDLLGSSDAVANMAKEVERVVVLGIAEMTNSVWMNGSPAPEAPNLHSRFMYSLQMEMGTMQELVYFGRLTDDVSDVPAFLVRHYGAISRFNPRLTKPNKDGSEPVQLSLTGNQSPKAPALKDLTYLHSPGTEEDLKTVTHWVVLDLKHQEGQDLASQTLRYLQFEQAAHSRVAFVLRGINEKPSVLEETFYAATLLPTRRAKIATFLETLLLKAGVESADDIEVLAEEAGLNVKNLKNLLADKEELSHHLQAQASFIRDLGLPAEHENVVVTNGRVMTAQSEGNVEDRLVAPDFLLLDNYAINSQMSNAVQNVLVEALAEGDEILVKSNRLEEEADREEGTEEDEITDEASNAALIASSVLAVHLSKTSTQGHGYTRKLVEMIGKLETDNTLVQIDGSPDNPISIVAVLDPLSKTAQQLSGILNHLRQTLQPNIKIHLNPASDLSKIPLTSYYSLALPTIPGSTGEGEGGPSASFTGLPSTKVLTLHMDVPEAWLVEPVRTAYDLDNLRLSDLPPNAVLTAQFELEALLLTGTCTDEGAVRREQIHPRGVQLHLGTASEPKLKDTLVMSNLGYFQLKADPSSFNLTLAPGRSQDLYTVVSNTADSVGRVQLPVAIDSFDGKNIKLRLHKRPGLEMEDVLNVPANGNQQKAGWLGAFKGKMQKATGSSEKKISPEDDPDTIHIFTIASGHMYERLQKIMILSLLSQTKNHVKVWFIKNYMSPQMKRFLPHMAEKYGFDYEFVTYKWPSWLHKQTDKQRIIWAYKILFLDVLFPLNLKKVIFVDSDQIIRADFAELWNMDLQGAPLAYTPFCDNNKDMDGFRFWKQGFWVNHLQGKPYHISALYVVDLQMFRQMAAGDHLRVVYEQLSKDPNSLANLDQDLPNYAQHMVPIFSLPQGWLWCETWCGNSTKHAAKTIDLCNNPLTKEPKLKSARRIAPEWIGFDEEAQLFTAAVEEKLLKQAKESGEEFDSGELQLSSQTQEESLSSGAMEDDTDSNAKESPVEDDGQGGEQDSSLGTEKTNSLDSDGMQEAGKAKIAQGGAESKRNDESAREQNTVRPDVLSETERYMAELSHEASRVHDKPRTKSDHSEL